MSTDARQPRTLLFSLRNTFRGDLFRCPLYEFEDIISQLDSVDVLAPQMDPSDWRHTLSRRVAFHAPVRLNPGLPRTRVTKQYDLFFAICGAPGDLLMLNTVANWSEACKTSICLLDEFWVKQMSEYRNFLPILRKFDIVLLYYSQSVKTLGDLIERPCVFLPPAADTILFCPHPPLDRTIDVYSIGRRSAKTHEALLKMVQDKGIFYLHDSMAGNQAIHSKEHRQLFAQVIKRSRYFIVNPGLIDRPDRRGNQMEIGNRYFEGAASGTIMLGEHPRNDEFQKHFDWPDAVIHVPYDSAGVQAIIEDLDKQPERQHAMRRINVRQALRRHDWVYRWESVLKLARLEPMPAVAERKSRLEELAAQV